VWILNCGQRTPLRNYNPAALYNVWSRGIGAGQRATLTTKFEKWMNSICRVGGLAPRKFFHTLEALRSYFRQFYYVSEAAMYF